MNSKYSFINAMEYLINDEASIYDAMDIIEKGEERICFIVNKNNVLLKVITDGDIRRALLKNLNIKDKVIDIHNRQPIVIHEKKMYEEAERILNKRILVAPVINKLGEVIGLLRYKDIMPQIDIKSYNVSILGLGYVGLTLGLVMADQGFKIIGYDIDKKLINKLEKKESPFFEKGIENYIYNHINNNMKVSSDLNKISADIYIITVGTPINKKTKLPEVKNIINAAKNIGIKLKPNDLVVLRSTVPIGCTRNTVIPTLEKYSKLNAGKDFSVAFCPERTAEGRALEELRNLPQIVGGLDIKSRELGLRLFGANTHTVIDIGSLEAAEMCKLMDNSYRDTRFAFANQMAKLSEKLGLNVNHLINKVNLAYERNTIPYPSPGVGGACLSKDPYILISNFNDYKLDSSFIKEARKVNESAPTDIYNRTCKYMKVINKDIKEIKIFIIGLAFKGNPETSDLRESTTVWFIEKLLSEGIENIWGYDPIVTKTDIESTGIKYCNLSQGFLNCDAVYFMNNHPSYSRLDLSLYLNKMNKPAYFFDGWNIFSASDIISEPSITYSGIGL